MNKKIVVGGVKLSEVKNLSTHLLIDLEGVDYNLLNDMGAIAKTLESAAISAGAEIIGEIKWEFKPQGVTIIIGVSESHLSIHTWPEDNFAAVDIFFCGDKVNLGVAQRVIIEYFRPQSVRAEEVCRGPRRLAQT